MAAAVAVGWVIPFPGWKFPMLKGETQTDCFGLESCSAHRRESFWCRLVVARFRECERERTRVFYSSMIWVKNKVLLLGLGAQLPHVRQFVVYYGRKTRAGCPPSIRRRDTCLEWGLSSSLLRSDNRIIKRWVSKGHMWRTGSFVAEIEMFAMGFMLCYEEWEVGLVFW